MGVSEMFDTTSTDAKIIPFTPVDPEAVARALYVAEIKAKVQNGTYQPNLKVVAERLLADVQFPHEA